MIFYSRVKEGMIEIKFKYNGYWRIVPRTGRKKHDLENQKTLKVEMTVLLRRVLVSKLLSLPVEEDIC